MGRGENRGESDRKNPAPGVSLSALWCPLCRADTIWPAGMLLSKGLGGVERVSYLEGGWVTADRYSINSTGVNY